MTLHKKISLKFVNSRFPLHAFVLLHFTVQFFPFSFSVLVSFSCITNVCFKNTCHNISNLLYGMYYYNHILVDEHLLLNLGFFSFRINFCRPSLPPPTNEVKWARETREQCIPGVLPAAHSHLGWPAMGTQSWLPTCWQESGPLTCHWCRIGPLPGEPGVTQNNVFTVNRGKPFQTCDSTSSRNWYLLF